MMIYRLSRRQLLLGACAASLVAALPAASRAETAIHVVKGTGCGCCTAWVKYLRAEGFDVAEEERYPSALIQYKLANGIPQNMISCHTGEVAGYMLEGHVPGMPTALPAWGRKATASRRANGGRMSWSWAPPKTQTRLEGGCGC